ncbi:Secreted peptide [Phytophthora megakarya]|uniref:Secreted peptide n=1 Tax=Phytophthora megakarya TaxID=4795 RepID=A0A225WL59_9STRA|nr:Secreted peptide [Phytophthora megakarya]
MAEVKTNTAQQRAMIAASIVIPKLLYVARHAWPAEEQWKTTDRCIRNVVWNSAFVDPGPTWRQS